MPATMNEWESYDIPPLEDVPKHWSLYKLYNHRDQLARAMIVMDETQAQLRKDTRIYSDSSKNAVDSAFSVTGDFSIMEDLNIRFIIMGNMEVFESIDDMIGEMSEIRRTLRPDVHFIYLEHDSRRCLMICKTAVE